MRIVTTGARALLLNRVQCLRDKLSELEDTIDAIILRKDVCCGVSSESSSSSESSGEVDPMLWEDDDIVEWGV